jgi:hypothetical protein
MYFNLGGMPTPSNGAKTRSISLPEVYVFLAGVAFLILGGMVYVVDRPGVLFLPATLSRFARLFHFGVLSGQLPAFAHACGFTLLTVAVLRLFERAAQVALIWFIVETIFELGQHRHCYNFIEWLLPKACQSTTSAQCAFVSYFRNGTFDYLDLLAAGLGAACACLVTRLTLAHARQL